LPKAAILPIVHATGLRWRPLADAWARRRLLVATRMGHQDPAVEALVRFLAEPSQKAKARGRKEQ